MVIEFNHENEVQSNSTLGTLNLSKGQSLNLEKNGNGIKHLRVGLGWDAKRSFWSTYDLDASVFLLNSQNKLVEDYSIVYYGRLSLPGINHLGDNLTGQGDGDDEQIIVDLSKVDSHVDKLVFIVNIFDAVRKKQSFGSVKNSYISLTDVDTDQKLVQYNLNGDFSTDTGVLVAELIRTSKGWTFHAIGEGVSGDISEISNRYK